MMHELHQHERSLFDKSASWSDIENNYMRHIIKMQEECDGTCLVAYVDGVAAGFIFGYVEGQDDSRIEVYLGKELRVSDGFVHKDYRGKGIFRKLNRELEKIYVGKGIRRICLNVRVNNTRARAFTESEGYVVTKLVYEKWL
ncbi:MAG: family N-acetyltransferase [Flavipsychrobacter sp.]|nr:family N-acetyltransferase [Flavipsychrobacter sp.]